VVDPAWAAIDWTPSRALRTVRFWWVIVGYFAAGFVWYAVQVHQTKYLIEVGFSPVEAAWALGLVAMVAIPAQIALGALSDRVGREIVWTISCAGFAVCYAALLALEAGRSEPLLYLMVFSQGLLGYALTGIMGPIVAELFEGRHYGTILGIASGGLIAGGAAGPFVAGVVHDLTGSYRLAFIIAIALCLVSIVAIWLAAPRRVRVVPGRVRDHAGTGSK
jgi:MFS family permease